MITLYLFPLLLSLFFCKPVVLDSPANQVMIGIPSDPYSIDPIFSTDLSSKKLNSFIFQRLFENDHGAIVKSPFVKKIYWKKRKQNWALGVELGENRFSSGKIVSSDDCIFSLRRLRDTESPRKADFSFIAGFQKISDLEFLVITDQKSEKYLASLSTSFASIYDEDSFQKEKKFVSLGPYSLEEWDRNDKIVLKRNLFFRKYFLPQSLVLRILPQATTGLFLFKKKSLDIFQIPFFLVDEFKKKDFQFVKKIGNSVQYVAINHLNSCFDKNFRKALNYSVNKNLIIEKLLSGTAGTVFGPLPEKYYSRINVSSSDEFYKYNQKKAISYLKRSQCYPDLLKQKLDFRMRGDDINRSIGLSIQKYLKEIGVNVSISPMEKIHLYKENGEKKGDLTLLTWYLDSDSIYNFLDPIFAKDRFGNGGNRSFYANNFIQNRIHRIREDEQLVHDKIYLKEIFAKIVEDAPWIFLWSVDENYILSEKAKAFPDLQEFL